VAAVDGIAAIAEVLSVEIPAFANISKAARGFGGSGKGKLDLN